MPRIEIHRLTKRFPARAGLWRGAPVVALDGIALTIEPGELVCIMGPNGAGKTTLLRVLATLLLPNAGDVLIDGQSLFRHARFWQRRIGVVAGDLPGFYDRLSGRENLEFYGALYGLPHRMMRQRVDEVAAWCDVHEIDRPYQECSTGVKQRFLLVRSLLHDPEILLLDEPTRSLDPLHAVSLRRLLRDRFWSRGKTVIMTTHQPTEARDLADRTAILDRGRLLAVDTFDRLEQRPDLRPFLTGYQS